MPSNFGAPLPYKGHIVVYADSHCGGESTQFFDDVFTLHTLGWDYRVSSIVVLAGQWQCFRENGYYAPRGPVLTRGIYSNLNLYGIDNDSITSLKCVG